MNNTNQNHPEEPEEPARIAAYKRTPVDTERRTARIQLVCKPSTVRKIAAMARALNISVSHFLETFIEMKFEEFTKNPDK